MASDKVEKAFMDAYIENKWEDCFTPLREVYNQAWEDAENEYGEQIENLKISIKKAKHEIECLIWNERNDFGRGVTSFAEEALKHLTMKE